MISDKKIKRLFKGNVVQLNKDEVQWALKNMDWEGSNYDKLIKSNRLGKGARIQLTTFEVQSGGALNIGKAFRKVEKAFKSKEAKKIGSKAKRIAKKGLKIANEGMRRIGEDTIQNQVVNRVVKEAAKVAKSQKTKDIINSVGDVVKDELVGIEGAGIGRAFKKAFSKKAVSKAFSKKNVTKALKKINNVTKGAIGSSLTDMAIDTAVGTVMPGIAGDIVKHQLKTQVNKQIGGALNPYLPKALKGLKGGGFKSMNGEGFKIGRETYGGALSSDQYKADLQNFKEGVYHDKKPLLRPNQPGFADAQYKLPESQGVMMVGRGFKNY